MFFHYRNIFSKYAICMLWTLILLLYMLFPAQAFAQGFSQEEETLFAYEVKQIDEFFERFNDQKTLIKDFIIRYHELGEVSRDVLIKSLFDLRSTSIRKEDVFSFLKTVNNEEQPVTLSFFDEDWYALLRCSVLYQQKKREMWLVMKVQREKNGASKWVIDGVHADFLRTPEAIDSTASLNPISHGTEFMGLSKVFEDTKNLKSYLPATYQEDQLSMMVLEMQNKRLSFLHVEEVSYHFLQINGWIITVENFKRADKNSGWLISRLVKADPIDKNNYKQRVLKLKI